MKLFLTTALLGCMALSPCLANDQQLRRRIEETEEEVESGQHQAFQSRIVGGTVADASDYPFHVNIGGCGGTL